MVQLAHDYLIEYLTNKRAELADQLFDEGVVHKDVVGGSWLLGIHCLDFWYCGMLEPAIHAESARRAMNSRADRLAL